MGVDINDYWVDPNAELCGEIAAARFSTLWAATRETDRWVRHFALPSIALTVECTSAAAGALLTAAFAHLETDGPAPNGDPMVWRIGDANDADALADFPSLSYAMHQHGQFNSSQDSHTWIERRRGLITVYDTRTASLTSICETAGALENDVIAKPLLRFLMGILQKNDIYLAHAALIGLNGRGLLVTGKGGMGKSTISSAALGGGLSFCADDFVALERTERGIIGHSLFASLMLHSDQVARHPYFEGQGRASRSSEVPKTVVLLGEKFKSQTVPNLHVDAIAVPRICPDAHSRLDPLSWVKVMGALAPTSVFSSPWREVDRARFLMELASDLTCLEYVSGSDFAAIPDPVRKRYG